MEGIIWEDVNNEIDDEKIKNIEEYFGIKFPIDYIECVKKNNGGSPIPCVFNIGEEDGYVFNNLLEIKKIVSCYNNLEEYLKEIIPFAEDPAGNLICFDYRQGKNKFPEIVFWDHEEAAVEKNKAIKYICKSFAKLLNSLHLDEEDD